ncbi:MAG: hypothetical protein RLZZ505_2553 [Verrucomicrobiota bacterium]
MAARRKKKREGSQMLPQAVSYFEKLSVQKIQSNLGEIALSGQRFRCRFT